MLLALLPRLFARHLFAFGAGLIATAAALLAQTPAAADGFDPNVDGNVYALATQADGKIVIGGQFSHVQGSPRNNLARLNPDGTLDESFNPNPDGTVRAIVIQPDNRLVIGGDFKALQPNATGAAVNRSRVARLEASGSVEPTFNPNLGGALGGVLTPQVFALVLQPNGQIVVGGSFGTTQPGNATTATTRNNLARFNADGSLDASYNPNPNAVVLALAAHVDNKIVVGGGFTTFQPAGDSSPTTRNRIARLNPSGTVDSEFNPNANNGVTTLAVQRDGKIVLGGYFTTLQPLGDDAPANRVHIGRLNANGTLDSEFYPRVEGDVATVAVQPDGGILVGGTFTSVWGRGTAVAARAYAARFNPDGSLDGNFAPILNAAVDAFAPQADGKVILGGHFTRALPKDASAALVRNHVARLNADGSIDASFQLDSGGRILASVTQADGKVVIAGTFTNVGGVTRNYVARLNTDGTVDSTYNPDFNGRVYALAYEASSGKVLVGGAFTTIGGETRNHIARLNPSGTIDSEFNPNIDGQVGVITLQGDGRILVGGTFTTVQPLGASEATHRANLLRLNTNGTLDTTFDPSPNSSVSAITVQSDNKILLGGMFSTLAPGQAANTSATITSRSFFARINADGTLDTTFSAHVDAQVSTIVVQSDNKIVIGGAFANIVPTNGTSSTVRNHIARLNADGTLDTAYDPNANSNVLTAALQSDGKLLIGGSFTTLQPNGASDWTLRKYAARLNTDGTVDATFNLDINEQPGNRVDSLRVQSDGRILIGGSFNSLQPVNTPARLTRRNFARLTANAAAVDAGFDVSAGGSTGALVKGFAVQPDGKVIAVGDFADLGGAKTTNIARFLPEGTADKSFSPTLATDGPVNTVAIRPISASIQSQAAGFAWLNANGTLRATFNPNARLSGQVNAFAVQSDGALLLGGAFANLNNSTGGNLVRFNASGVLDTSFNPNPNGAVTAIALQSDGKILIGGAFSIVNGAVRNHLARLNRDGSLDEGFDPNANGKVSAILLQNDGLILVGGAFTTLTPNGTSTSVTRNYLARLNSDGTVDASYDPAPNLTVNAIALQSDGKLVAGGVFTSVQPNSGTTAFARSGIARFNTDGSLDQNFDPNANGAIAAIVPLANGQFIIGGSFTTLQPNGASAGITRNNLARINSDGAVDAAFTPSANGAVTAIALDSTGAVLIGGAFSTVQGADSSAQVSRNRLARLTGSGSLDLNFNPGANGNVTALASRPDGSVLVGGNFTALQLDGSIIVGGLFASIGGLPARNLASLNDDGSVNPTFQPRPNGAINALLVLPDGKTIVGGAFTTIADTTRNRLARFNADGTLDTAFNPNADGAVNTLALQADGKILVGGSFTTIGGQAKAQFARLNADGTLDGSFAPAVSGAVTGIAVQADGRVLYVGAGSGIRSILRRVNADGSADNTFAALSLTSDVINSLALQADGRIVIGGSFTTLGTVSVARLARLNTNGTVDTTFVPAPNGPVTAVALQSDGRVVAGGSFTSLSGQPRVGIARVAATSAATQILGVTANRSTVIWNRAGSAPEVSAVIFEQSLDRFAWTRLGTGTRLANSSDWQLTGLNLPASGLFYIRARGIASSGGTSSSLLETVREFNYTNPLAPAAAVAQTPAQASAPAVSFDPVTGIAPRATVTVVAGEGSVEIFATQAQRAGGTLPRLANLSTRGRVTPENPLILGFAIAGSESRSVLVRAAGPALANFGVSDSLAAARLEVYDVSGAVIATNDGWAGAAHLVQAAVATGAFPLTAGSADSAALLTLAPGNYTVRVIDARGTGGVGLAEIYDAGTSSASRLVNVSSRGAAGTGSAALISGFVIAGGDTAGRVLLRGVGPGLAQFGAGNLVADPSIALYDAENRVLGGNDNWVSSVTDIRTAAAASGAFALEAGSKDAAVLATLPSGAYTIQVSAGSTGTALLEIYEVR